MLDNIPPTTTSCMFDILRTNVQTALIKNPKAQKAFLPIFCNLPLGPNYEAYDVTHLSSQHEAAQSLATFFTDSFPTIVVCSPRYVATVLDETNWDATKITIHGRIEEAFCASINKIEPVSTTTEASSPPESCSMLSFLIVVKIVHETAHAVRHLVQNGVYAQLDDVDPPYYCESSRDPLAFYPEAGFLVEKALFGGQIGVVPKDDIDGERPPFFELDYLRIAYFFLLCHDGAAYRPDPSNINRWLDEYRLIPFDTSSLVQLTGDAYPKNPCLRLCAQLNSTHLPRRIESESTVDPDEQIGKTLKDYQLNSLSAYSPSEHPSTGESQVNTRIVREDHFRCEKLTWLPPYGAVIRLNDRSLARLTRDGLGTYERFLDNDRGRLELGFSHYKTTKLEPRL